MECSLESLLKTDFVCGQMITLGNLPCLENNDTDGKKGYTNKSWLYRTLHEKSRYWTTDLKSDRRSLDRKSKNENSNGQSVPKLCTKLKRE